MSMHLRGSRDMMGQEEEGWWKSRTGLEQKLIILSTLLFIVTFSLTISVIVIKNRKPDCPSVTTLAPTGSTSSDQTSTDVTSSEQTPIDSTISDQPPATSVSPVSPPSEAPNTSTEPPPISSSEAPTPTVLPAST